MSNPFRYFNSSPEVIRLVVMMYVRYPLSLRNVEDMLAERGIDISHETVRFWWNRFGPMFAAEIRRRRVAHMRGYPQWRWHLDEVFVKVNGKLHYLWRAVDHEGEVLEAVVTARRDKAAALKLLKRIMKKYCRPREDRHRQASCVFRGDERNWRRRSARGRRSAQQSQRIRISRFGDANGRCSAFEVCRRCRSSAQFMPRCTTNSIRSAISSRGKSTSRDALLPWPSGAPLRRRSTLARWRSRCMSTSLRYFDTAVERGAAALLLAGFGPSPTRHRRSVRAGEQGGHHKMRPSHTKQDSPGARLLFRPQSPPANSETLRL